MCFLQCDTLPFTEPAHAQKNAYNINVLYLPRHVSAFVRHHHDSIFKTEWI